MKNIFLGIFLLFDLVVNAQSFSIELEGGVVSGLNRFIRTRGDSPYFRQQFVLGPSVGLLFSWFPKRERANSYLSLYFGSNGKSVAALVKKGEKFSSKESGNGGDPNVGLRWNYYGKNKRPYRSGIMLGANMEYIRHRFTALGGIGSIYLDKITKTYGINPSMQIGLFKGLKLSDHTYLRFTLYGNIGFKTTSSWYYHAVVENTEYAAVIKSRGDFITLSVSYGYWPEKNKSGNY